MQRLILKLTAAAIATCAVIIGAKAETLDVFYSNAAWKPLYEAVARKFEEENPGVTIKYRTPVPGYEEMLQTILRDRVTGDIPDVAFVGLNRVEAFADSGLGIPLGGLLSAEAEDVRKGYIPAMLNMAQSGGQTMGLPFQISTPSIFYNADLVREAGGDPDNFPATWEEIVALAKKISQSNKNISGIYFNYYTISGNWTFMALIQSMGGRMMSSDNTKIEFDGDAGLKALQILRSFGEAGMIDMSAQQSEQAFVAGTLGMVVTSSSSLTGLLKGAGSRFKVGVAPFPILAENGTIPAGGNAAMLLSQSDAQQKAAWEFIKFATGSVGQTIMVQNSGYAPSNSIATSDPDLLGKFYDENPLYKVSVSQLPVTTGWYSFPGENSVKITDVIRDHLQTVATLRKTPEQALEAMASDVRKLLPQ